ncbi:MULTISPECIES: PH domain-containing protein [unclassified Alteromonas]|uniref:PH domain-containing protein n=1 Tax=unclassified Alteromonas TaxID=2614992 RepID=UPI000C572A7E|nr:MULTISPECIES: PH domain-containing protein [unclassified Alteromonas]AYA65711.1 PH domain-containing protein [Alteromonas sp. RKMC-009]MBT79978.1 helicase [Alteromonadaceae bacterium]MDO6477060.1 PH domain-containing protein [Alteromonas sp. 1_MG-2023]MEC7690047.1 PH domain-containing protein [Pseudomonadota bacterium]
MGLFDALLGNASETDAQAVAEELAPVLGAGESVVSAYKLVRDLIVFTSGRMILIDKQGLTGRKVNYHSIPYKSITQFVVETAGHFDTDSELKIWVSGQDAPVEIELSKNAAQGVQNALANQMFG